MSITLYSVSSGPPSLAVRMALKYLNIDYELVNINYGLGEHMTDEYGEKNPQKEIPVLDDDGFYLSESNAILQYLVDQYGNDDKIYPKEPKARAIVNHRLCFNMGFYYTRISEHQLGPIFFDYQKTTLTLKKLNIALDVFNTYLKRTGTKYAAADHITIADFALISTTMCLEATNFAISEYPFIEAWYKRFKTEYPDLWKIAESGMVLIAEFVKNPPDLRHLNHPTHPART